MLNDKKIKIMERMRVRFTDIILEEIEKEKTECSEGEIIECSINTLITILAITMQEQSDEAIDEMVNFICNKMNMMKDLNGKLKKSKEV